MQRGTKTDQCVHENQLKLSHTTIAIAIANCHTKLHSLHFSVWFHGNVCLCVFALCLPAQNVETPPPDQKKHDFLKLNTTQYFAACCRLLFLCLPYSLSDNWTFCVVYFVQSFFSRKIHIDINFYCQIGISVGYIFIMCSAIFMTLFGAYTLHSKQTNNQNVVCLSQAVCLYLVLLLRFHFQSVDLFIRVSVFVCARFHSNFSRRKTHSQKLRKINENIYRTWFSTDLHCFCSVALWTFFSFLSLLLSSSSIFRLAS